MAETLLDIKTFGGLNFSPNAEAGECAIALNLDDANAPALRTAYGFTDETVTETGTFQGHLIEQGKTVMSVFDDTLYMGQMQFPLEPLGVPRRFLRITPKDVLIFPDCYRYSYSHVECAPLDERFTSEGTATHDDGKVRVKLTTRPLSSIRGRVYLDDAGYTYYDPETAPGESLLYFEVESYDHDGSGCALVLKPVTNGTGMYSYSSDKVKDRLTLRQVYPRMDHVMIFRNRLWCVGGMVLTASKLGDYLNFTDFSGLSTDSFSMEVEEPLNAISHFGERVVFMSKTHLYELYGDRPSNYQVSAPKSGGCTYPDSVCTAGGYLIYADDRNLYRYGGGDPQVTTERLDFPQWTSVFGVSDGESCYLGIDGHLYRYRPKRNTFYALDRTATLGITQQSTCFFYNNKGYFCPNRERTGEVHFRSGWLCLDKRGRVAPKEILLRIDGAVDEISLVTRDGTRRPLPAIDDRGDGLLRLPFPADLTHRVFAVDIRGHGDICLQRLTVRG